MDSNRFWMIIDSTVRSSGNRGEQLEALRDALNRLSADEISGFQSAFQREQQRAYSWDLWGAAYVIHGGASDDGFEYFQRWLISRGRQTFEAALADHDSLADAIPDGAEHCEFEGFSYVAINVWSEKMGIDAFADPQSTFPYTGAPPGDEPTGIEFEDTETHLSRRYPKLWKRFGHNPLG